MLTRIITFILLFAFAMQSFQKNLIVLDYVANITAYIEQCINRDKPELKCKGRCQMMKKLQAEEEKEQQNPEHKGENKGPTLFPSPEPIAAAIAIPRFIKSVFKPFEIKQPVDRPSSVFQPPAHS